MICRPCIEIDEESKAGSSQIGLQATLRVRHAAGLPSCRRKLPQR
jgi:hypothetical protein